MFIFIASLLTIQIHASSATFWFGTRPQTIRVAYTTKPLAECGSGRTVRLRGAAHLVIHFVPARTAPSFATRRLRAVGRLRELAKVCDFESDLGWAIGLDRRRAYMVSRAGTTVTITFR